MALIKLSVLAPLIVADAAAIATELANGVTTANVVALADLLTVLAGRKDLLFPALQISKTAKVEFQPE